MIICRIEFKINLIMNIIIFMCKFVKTEVYMIRYNEINQKFTNEAMSHTKEEIHTWL